MIRNIQFAVIVVLVAICTSSLAQICDARSGAPIVMQVQLAFGDLRSDTVPGVVAIQNDSTHKGDAAGVQRSRDFADSMQIHVQLQDHLGGTLQEASPTPEGQVRLTVCKNSIYRLRVSGPVIEETLIDDLHPGRGDKLVTVVLHRKSTDNNRSTQKPTVSALRLRVPRKAQKQLEKGDEALKQGKLEDAKKYYLKATEIYPQFEEAENNLGIALMKEGNRTAGKAAFERAVALNDHFAPAYVNLAKIAVDDRRFNDASAFAKQALTTEPLNPAALFVAAESAFFKEDFSETVRCTRTLHSLPHQQYALAHFLAGKSLEAQNQFAGAISEYQTFLNEDSGDPNFERARERLRLLQLAQSAASQSAPH